MPTRERNDDKMSDAPIIDELVLSFERQGFYLTPRQHKFCRLMLKHGQATKAARLAGFPDPEDNGQSLWSTYSAPLTHFRNETRFEHNLVVNGYTRMAQAENDVILNSAEVAASSGNIAARYEQVPNDSIQKIGFEGLRKVFGMDAAQGLVISDGGKAELPPSTQEMLKNAYEQ